MWILGLKGLRGTSSNFVSTIPIHDQEERFKNALIIFHIPGLSKVDSCWQKPLPTWLVSASYSVWHFFYRWRLLNKISLDWLLKQISRLLQNFLTTLHILPTDSSLKVICVEISLEILNVDTDD